MTMLLPSALADGIQKEKRMGFSPIISFNAAKAEKYFKTQNPSVKTDGKYNSKLFIV